MDPIDGNDQVIAAVLDRVDRAIEALAAAHARQSLGPSERAQ
jgi:hypothetical protein